MEKIVDMIGNKLQDAFSQFMTPENGNTGMYPGMGSTTTTTTTTTTTNGRRMGNTQNNAVNPNTTVTTNSNQANNTMVPKQQG